MARKTVEMRMAEHSALDPDTGCILWTGSLNNRGYGQTRFGSGPREGIRLAHRMAYEAKHGEIPHGLFVLHKCDNPPCVNVDHLFLGTNAENMIDAAIKGRVWQQKKTHCPRGHPYSGDNLCFAKKKNGRPRRVCRECERLAYQRRKHTPEHIAYVARNKERVAANRKRRDSRMRAERNAANIHQKGAAWQLSTSTSPVQPSSPLTSSPTAEIPTCEF